MTARVCSKKPHSATAIPGPVPLQSRRRPTLRGVTSLWRDREFLKFWVGQTISDFGDQITLLALPLTAVITLHAGPVEMGVLAAVAAAPTALFSLFAGVWVDPCHAGGSSSSPISVAPCSLQPSPSRLCSAC